MRLGRRGAANCDERVCLSVCLSARTHISEATSRNFTKLSLNVTSGCDSVMAVLQYVFFIQKSNRFIDIWQPGWITQEHYHSQCKLFKQNQLEEFLNRLVFAKIRD